MPGRFYIETKVSAKRWQKCRFTYSDRAEAIVIASDLEEHGNTVRVRSAEHTDGMDRTEWVSVTT